LQSRPGVKKEGGADGTDGTEAPEGAEVKKEGGEVESSQQKIPCPLEECPTPTQTKTFSDFWLIYNNPFDK